MLTFTSFAQLSVWPSYDEVLKAKTDYLNLAKGIYVSKPKYVQFHEANFDRMLRIAEAGLGDAVSADLKAAHPKTIHML
jgi:hypothetical protein